VRLLIYSDLHLDANSFTPVLPDGSRGDANVDLVKLAGYENPAFKSNFIVGV
jgi:hypothetical protein